MSAAGLKQFGVSARDAHAKLMNDIVLNDGTFDDDGNYTKGASGKDAEQWTPIDNNYAGIFDGGGHTIRGLYVVNKTYAGLFNAVFGTVKNLTVTGYVSGTDTAGGIASQGGTFENCVNQCRVIAKHNAMAEAWAGGIVGYSGTVRNCVNMGRITSCSGYDVAYAGGLVGQGSAAGCYNVGEVDGTSNRLSLIGGITGYGSAENCYWLEGTAEKAIGYSGGVAANTKAEFADGTVLKLLQNGDENSPWTKCGYLEAAGMIVPLLSWQTTDSHDHNYGWQHNDTQHWKECACGVIEANSNAAHKEVIGICTEGIHCECGYEVYAATSGHNWTAWKHLTTSHTRNCRNPGCGITQRGNCTGGTATCTTPAVCEVCGESYGDKDLTNHTGTQEWTQTATTNEKNWSCCGAEIISTEPHDWANGVCTQCGYACTHSYEWQSENGEYWQQCTECGLETGKKAIPEIVINGADKVCRTQDYKFSFTLPEGVKDVQAGYGFTLMGSDVPLTEENGVYTGVVKTQWYDESETSFVLSAYAQTDDGFVFTVDKTVTILNEHTGGTATCKEQAKCEVCGESYGETDANNHADLKHIDAKAATKDSEGNIEYWHCSDCGKYFADKDGNKEIALADTVTEKLPDETPKTGDSSNPTLWLALLLVSGSTVGAITLCGRKKYNEE